MDPTSLKSADVKVAMLRSELSSGLRRRATAPAASPESSPSDGLASASARNPSVSGHDSAAVVEEASDQSTEKIEAEEKSDKWLGKQKESQDPFACHICFSTAQEPVVTPCGHLHCWPCIHEWFTVARGARSSTCPVCKAPCSASTVIPIYSESGTTKDPRLNAPPRPRPPAEPATRRAIRTSQSHFVPTRDSSFALRAGVYPLPGLSMTWQWGGGDAYATDAADLDDPMLPEEGQRKELIARLFIGLFIIWFLLICLS